MLGKEELDVYVQKMIEFVGTTYREIGGEENDFIISDETGEKRIFAVTRRKMEGDLTGFCIEEVKKCFPDLLDEEAEQVKDELDKMIRSLEEAEKAAGTFAKKVTAEEKEWFVMDLETLEQTGITEQQKDQLLEAYGNGDR